MHAISFFLLFSHPPIGRSIQLNFCNIASANESGMGNISLFTVLSKGIFAQVQYLDVCIYICLSLHYLYMMVCRSGYKQGNIKVFYCST